MFSPYLSEAQIKNLREHKYSCVGQSITERYMQPFWEWAATFMPLWVAPNLITIVGLGFNIVTSLLVIAYSPRANNESVPAHVFILCAAGLFTYQTLDAIDGKQARRTKTSSALGELFDHGCDAVSTVFVMTSLSCSVLLGYYPDYLYYFFIGISCYYYSAFWQYYCSGKLIFQQIDVNEALLSTMLVYIIAGLAGPQWVLFKLGFLPYNLNVVQVAVIIMGFICTAYYCVTIYRIFLRGDGTTVGGTHGLSPLLPLLVVIACSFVSFVYSEEELFAAHPCLFMLSFGCSFAKLASNLILATMSKSKLPLFDSCLIGPIGLATFTILQRFDVLSLTLDFVCEEYSVLLFITIINLASFLLFATCVCKETSRGLGINVFTIPYKKD